MCANKYIFLFIAIYAFCNAPWLYAHDLLVKEVAAAHSLGFSVLLTTMSWHLDWELKYCIQILKLNAYIHRLVKTLKLSFKAHCKKHTFFGAFETSNITWKYWITFCKKKAIELRIFSKLECFWTRADDIIRWNTTWNFRCEGPLTKANTCLPLGKHHESSRLNNRLRKQVVEMFCTERHQFSSEDSKNKSTTQMRLWAIWEREWDETKYLRRSIFPLVD